MPIGKRILLAGGVGLLVFALYRRLLSSGRIRPSADENPLQSFKKDGDSDRVKKHSYSPENMPIGKRILLAGGVALLVLALLYGAFYFIFLDLMVDLWWFRSLEFESYFWLRLLYRYFISGGVTLLFFLVFFLNFWVASNFVGVTLHNLLEVDSVKRTLAHKFKSGALDVYLVVSVVLAVIVAFPFYDQWEVALLYFFAPEMGINDPFYHNDISFYLFSFPIYRLIQQELLTAFALLLLAVAFLYWLEQRVLASAGEKYPKGVRIHLAGLLICVCLLVSWGFMLQRFGLVYESSHEPVFFGPGYVEMRYHLPLIWVALVSFMLAAVSAIVMIYSQGQSGKRPLFGFLVVFLLAVALRHVPAGPSLLTRLVVHPNPVETEKAFMQGNIEATLSAYNLSNVETLDFEVSLTPENDLADWATKGHLQNVPVWDHELLGDVYNQLQGIRPYYRFQSVDEDRYLINGRTQQVNLSARELNIEKLPDEAHTWENIHLRYTHGYGAVVTPAAQDAGRRINWYLRDLTLQSGVGFGVKNPEIYYGLDDYAYVIVPNLLDVVDIAGKNPVADQYAGIGGIPISSLFRKLLFSVYLNEEKVFFSTSINDQSRMLIRRNIRERIATVTPFLRLDRDPYLVVAENNLFWVQDAYTVSDQYPVSKPLDASFDETGSVTKINYIRNSVKVVVDAYSGAVSYYVVDSDDPIINGYGKAYPGIFQPVSQMPAELKSHLRYPRDLFYYQMQIYSKYHQRDPAAFYQQAETWDFPKTNDQKVMPYFLTTEIEGCPGIERFILVEPMTPVQRHNLSVLAIAGSLDFETCGAGFSEQIAVYKFRKDIQVDGPAQINALIDQDPLISEQFTLWDQHGSTVTRGRMVIMPLGHSVLYIQPIYLISTQTSIPELVRVIVSMGDEVVMDEMLESAFRRLEARLRRESPVLPGGGPPDPTGSGDRVSVTENQSTAVQGNP